jgi:nitric oxide reductase subunit B
VFLSGDIIGTFHPLYFSGTPAVVMGLGEVFSALGVVPLVLIGFEAWENLRLAKVREWVSAYRWAIYFFVAVAFGNLLGADLFGFLINLPIALCYRQGLNTTPVHGHTALFGVYGMLGLGLMLFCVRGLMPQHAWKTGAIRFSLWAINLGLFLMAVVSLLPVTRKGAVRCPFGRPAPGPHPRRGPTPRPAGGCRRFFLNVQILDT